MIYTASKKIYLLFVILLSLFVLTACWKKENVDVVDDTNTQQEQVSEDWEEWTLKTTMENIFKKWKATTCKFTINEDWQSFQWVLYVDGKKMRYGSKWTVEWQTFEANVILKDGFSYSWTSMDNKWFKMKEAEWEENNNEDVWAEERVKEMDFDCKKWVDKWIFELPSTIEFSEFTMPVGK
jgi:hypothetical protein